MGGPGSLPANEAVHNRIAVQENNIVVFSNEKEGEDFLVFQNQDLFTDVILEFDVGSETIISIKVHSLILDALNSSSDLWMKRVKEITNGVHFRYRVPGTFTIVGVVQAIISVYCVSSDLSAAKCHPDNKVFLEILRALQVDVDHIVANLVPDAQNLEDKIEQVQALKVRYEQAGQTIMMNFEGQVDGELNKRKKAGTDPLILRCKLCRLILRTNSEFDGHQSSLCGPNFEYERVPAPVNPLVGQGDQVERNEGNGEGQRVRRLDEGIQLAGGSNLLIMQGRIRYGKSIIVARARSVDSLPDSSPNNAPVLASTPVNAIQKVKCEQPNCQRVIIDSRDAKLRHRNDCSNRSSGCDDKFTRFVFGLDEQEVNCLTCEAIFAETDTMHVEAGIFLHYKEVHGIIYKSAFILYPEPKCLICDQSHDVGLVNSFLCGVSICLENRRYKDGNNWYPPAGTFSSKPKLFKKKSEKWHIRVKDTALKGTRQSRVDSVGRAGNSRVTRSRSRDPAPAKN